MRCTNSQIRLYQHEPCGSKRHFAMPPQGGQSTSEASHKAQNEYHDARFSLLAPIKPTLSKPSRVARRQYVASSQAEGPDRVTTSRMTVFSDALAIMIPLLFIRKTTVTLKTNTPSLTDPKFLPSSPRRCTGNEFQLPAMVYNKFSSCHPQSSQ